MNKIVEMEFGSHLYGTAGPNSDHDYKGVFLPTMRDVFLQNVPKSIQDNSKKDSSARNSADDIDKEFYSLHYFLKLASVGETVALDMLHAPSRFWKPAKSAHPMWRDLVANRHRFYTKNLKALVGYARKQAAKYGVKGSRLAAAKLVLEFFRSQPADARVSDIWNTLPTGEFIFIHEGVNKGMDMNSSIYEVCGKKMTAGSKCRYYVPMLEAFVKVYGGRAQEAETNKGIDWKAVSHAFRAAYQVKHILTEGTFTYPLPETVLIKAVKDGSLDFMTEVRPKLDNLMTEVESLSAASSLPEHVDKEWVETWLCAMILDYASQGDSSHD